MSKAIRSTVPALVAAAVAAFLVTIPADAFAVSANPAGISGRTNKSGGSGCAACHGASADSSIAVAITGPTALEAGQAGTYTVTATRSATTNGTKMGVAIAASDSPTPLSVVGGMPTALEAGSGEVIHTTGAGALRTTTSNTANYQFTYTMPGAASVGSTHTLYAVSALGFLGWNHAPNFTVTTRPLATSSATASAPTSSTINVSWTGGGPNYRIVYKTGAVPPTTDSDGTIVNLGAVTSTTITGLVASTQYSFRVYSRTVAGTVLSTTGATATSTTTAVAAATRHVNAATGVNTGTCASAGSPCRTITYAMSQAVAGNPGDLVSVAPGTYTVALGEAFPIAFKSGVQLVATGNASNTFIDGTGDTVQQGLISSTSNASAAARIEGFTIRFGLNTPSTQGGVALGGALRIQNSSATFTVTRNVLDRNEARGYSADGSLGQTGGLGWGGALYVFSSAVNVTNNVFIGNLARGGNALSHPGTPLSGNENGGPGVGGAIYFGGTGMVANNTFYGNTALGGNGGISSTGTGTGGAATSGALSASGNPSPSIVNNIFSNNLAMSGTGGTQDLALAGALYTQNAPSNSNNLLFANSVNGGASSGDTPGTSAVLASPQFHDAAGGNLRIGLASPAKGAGTATGAPATDHDGVTRPNPPSIGAFEASAGPGDSDNDGIPDTVELVESRNPLAKDNDLFSPGAFSARLFAMQQYRDFLGREGDPAGIQGWADFVTAGTYSRPQAIDAFVNSPEFSGFVAPVVRLYFATYLRIPDYAGLAFNAGLVRAGTVTLTQLADFFTAGPEFVTLYGALDNTAFVTLLYQNVLGRAPDPAGLSGWVGLLGGGMSRGQVLLGFSDSTEYQAAIANEVLVTMMYTAMLRRTPETTGFNGWVGFLDGLTYTREQVINGFFLSSEYRARFLP